ncbi:MAG: membrane dipeptidase [bacterium]
MIIDGHLDLAWNALTLRRVLTNSISNIRIAETPDQWHREGTAMVSLPEMIKGKINIAFATIFAQPKGESPASITGYSSPEEAYNIAMQQVKWYEKIEQSNKIKIIRFASDLEDALINNKINLMLLMEGADPLRTIDDLAVFIDHGIRAIGPAWRKTRYAGGAGAPGPLTDEGRALLKEMDNKNIALDISHLSDMAIDEAIEIHNGPIFASHSNCRSITMKGINITPDSMYEKIAERQVEDKIIEQIASRKGTVGLVMYNPFIKANWNNSSGSLPLSTLMQHLNRIKEIGGIETAAIGSDLDGGVGVETTPDGLNTIADLQKIPQMMSDIDYSEKEIVAVKNGNLIRLMKMILKY